jgi:hypothetical protein
MSDDQRLKQLTEENKRLKAAYISLKTENDKLKSQLAEHNENDNPRVNEQIKQLTDSIKDLKDDVEDLRNFNVSAFYLSSLKKLVELNDRELKDRLTDLEKKINVNPEVIKPAPVVQFNKVEPPKEEIKQEVKPTVPETKEEEKKEEQLDLEKIEESIREDDQEVLTDDCIKVNEMVPVDDLILANATRAMKNVPDDLKFEEVEKEKPAFDAQATEPSEIQMPTTPSNEIEELSEEEVQREQAQAVVAQEPFAQVQNINIQEMFKDAHTKAVKSFVNIVKNINPKFVSNVEAELVNMPDNMKESFDNNIIVMPGVIQFEEPAKTRAA